MKEFKVRITETLQMDVYIEAETEEQAVEQAKKNYKEQDYILDADHFKGVEFEAVEKEV